MARRNSHSLCCHSLPSRGQQPWCSLKLTSLYQRFHRVLAGSAFTPLPPPPRCRPGRAWEAAALCQWELSPLAQAGFLMLGKIVHYKGCMCCAHSLCTIHPCVHILGGARGRLLESSQEVSQCHQLSAYSARFRVTAESDTVPAGKRA